MPKDKRPARGILPNVMHEALAQDLADGKTQAAAWLKFSRPELDEDERAEMLDKPFSSRNRDKHFNERNALAANAQQQCSKPEVKKRVDEILAERHDKRMKITMNEVKVSRARVTQGLIELVDRCMQAIPVFKRGHAVGTWRFEPMAAAKGLELLGLEQGMFERKHKHLHGRVNPLDGNRAEIVGRLGVLLDQLSDADLGSIGLQRIDVVEVRAERIDGVGRQQSPAVPALS